MKVEEFTREELIKIRNRAEELAKVNVKHNENWRRAYLNLADAADRVDAMICRIVKRDNTQLIEALKK